MKPSVLLFLLPVGLFAACSSSSGPAKVKHDCFNGSGSCYCSSFTNGTDEPSKSGTCSATAYPGAVCCASPGWPNMEANGSSGGCSCSTLNGTCPSGVETDETVSVDSCDFTGASVGGGTSGGSDSGAPTKCTDTGYCSPDGDNCTCGTECVHYGPGEYMCGFSCASSSDCTGKKDPPSGDALPSCNPGLQTDTADYDGFCVRQ